MFGGDDQLRAVAEVGADVELASGGLDVGDPSRVAQRGDDVAVAVEQALPQRVGGAVVVGQSRDGGGHVLVSKRVCTAGAQKARPPLKNVTYLQAK